MGVAAGVITGAVYAFAIFHSPLIYLNFLLTGALLFALGLTVSYGIYLFRIRNTKVGVLISFITFCVAYYVSWAVYIPTVLAHFGAGASSFDIPLISRSAALFAQSPWGMWYWIQSINYNGVWSITNFGGGSRNAIPVSGIFLAIIWVIEAGIIAFGTVALGSDQAFKPFSERQGKWLEPKSLPGRIAFVENGDEMLNAFARGDFSALTTRLTATAPQQYGEMKNDAVEETEKEEKNEKNIEGNIIRYGSVTLYQDSFEPYVTVHNVTISGQQASQTAQPKKKGIFKKILGWFWSSSKDEENTTIEAVVEYLRISPTVAQNISNALGV